MKSWLIIIVIIKLTVYFLWSSRRGGDAQAPHTVAAAVNSAPGVIKKKITLIMDPLLWWDFPPFNYSCCFHLKLIKCFRMANRAGRFRKNTQRHPVPARRGTFIFIFKGFRICFSQNGKKTTGFGALQSISQFSHTKERWTPVPWDFLESVRPQQRRVHHPDFNYLLWMEEVRRTGKSCSLWKVLIVISVPGHLQWRREHVISKVKRNQRSPTSIILSNLLVLLFHFHSSR